MSPLGTLSLNPINSVPHSIFQLMNVTTNHLLNHHHLPSLTHSPNSRRNFKRMTLKDHSHTADKQQVSVCPPGSIEFRLSSSHSNKHLNSPPLPHSIINYISQKDCSPSPSPPPTNMQNLVEAEDDEVLSIGQEDDNDNQSDKDKSEPNIMSPTIEHKTDELDDIDVDDSNGSSYGSSPPLSISIQSPASSLDSSYIPNSNRKRNYSSSEDVPTSPIKPPPVSTTGTTTNSSYHPLNSLSEVLLNQTMSRFHQQQQQQAAQAQASLFFSIANILRPDFGKLSPPPPTGNFHHHRPIAKPLKRTSLKPDKISPIDLSRTHLPNGQIKSKNSHHHHHHHHKSSSHPHPQQKSPNSQHLPSPPPQKQARQQQPLSKSSKVIKEDKLLEEMKQKNPEWPAWVFCTRYSDRPSSGPRTRRGRKQKEKEIDEKRPRTAFTAEQLSRLKKEFEENRYLTEKRRQDLANDLRLHENQIKIWFQNKRAKLKKANGQRGGLALQLMAQGLYNHSTIPPRGCGDEDEDDDDGDESD